MMDKKRLLLVEDEESLGYLLTEYLGMKNFIVKWAKNGKEALPLFDEQNFDLVILDVMMPEMDGFTLATKIKSNYPKVPFLFLTAKSLKIDVLKGFSVGAIDYLKKPIDEEELVARINAIISRIHIDTQVEESETYKLGKYVFNPKNQKLSHGKKRISLTLREAELLRMLVSNKNNLCTHREILVQLWGANNYFNRKSLNVFITRLRSYLKDDKTIEIKNVHGQGFILKTGGA